MWDLLRDVFEDGKPHTRKEIVAAIRKHPEYRRYSDDSYVHSLQRMIENGKMRKVKWGTYQAVNQKELNREFIARSKAIADHYFPDPGKNKDALIQDIYNALSWAQRQPFLRQGG